MGAIPLQLHPAVVRIVAEAIRDSLPSPYDQDMEVMEAFDAVAEVAIRAYEELNVVQISRYRVTDAPRSAEDIHD